MSTIEDIISAVTSLLAILLPWLVMLIAVMGLVVFLWWRIRRISREDARRASTR